MKALLFSTLLILTTPLFAQEIIGPSQSGGNLSLKGASSKPSVRKLEKIDLLKGPKGWNKGSIVLADESQVDGFVRYNQLNDFMSFSEDTLDTKVFTAKEVLYVSYLDEETQKKRVFYSIPYTPDGKKHLLNSAIKGAFSTPLGSSDDLKSGEQFLFFEVIREYKSFALLLRTSPVDARQETQSTTTTMPGATFSSSTPYGGVITTTPSITTTSSSTSTSVHQTERIFILDDAGNIGPYLELHHLEDGRKNLANGKDRKTYSKILNEDLLAQYVTEPVYDKLKAYAKENKLKFKRKDDFLKIIEYYDTLIQ